MILEKRIALLERAVVVLNKAPTMSGLQGSLEAEKLNIYASVACSREAKKKEPASPGCSALRTSNPERIESIGREIHALNAEFAATMTLCATYFGEETRKAVRAAGGGEWWKADQAIMQKVIGAMQMEMNAFQE